MYYDKTVDLTPKARKRRSHEIPEKDVNTPSEELTEAGNQRLYKNATIPLYMRDYFEVHVDFKDDAWMPSNGTKYENLAILKTHSRRNLSTLQVDFTETYMCHFLEEISSVYYSKDQVKVSPAVIHYKGVNGVLETQEPCGAAR